MQAEIIPRVFDNAEFGELRVLKTEDGEFWFVAVDVCSALSIGNPSQAMTRLDEDEKTLISNEGSKPTNYVNESGLYALVLSSRKPEAKAFKRWVTHEVLPAIRRDGGYIATNPAESDEDVMARALLIAQKTIERNQHRIAELEPKALYADAIMASKSTILVRDLAGLLTRNGYIIGQNRLFTKLREDGYLCRRKGRSESKPTQRALEMGLFETYEHPFTHTDGTPDHRIGVRVTPKGVRYFLERYAKVVPLL